MAKPIVVVFVVVAFASTAYSANPTWYEIKSDHFRVLTDGSEKEGRAVAREFEQIRAVLAAVLPTMRDSTVPLLIVAARDEGSAKRIIPAYWKGSSPKPGAVFWEGSQRRFSLIRLDLLRSGANTQLASYPYQTIYHQYTRILLKENFRWLPTWFGIGFSEFFANTRFQEGRFYVGAPSPRGNYAQNRPLLPMTEFIAVKKDYIPRTEVFYAQSWALIHMLMMKPNDEGKSLQRFVSLLEAGKSQKDSFQEAIGDLGDIEKQLALYISRRSFQNLVFSTVPQTGEDGFSSRKLSVAEVDAEIGNFQLWQRDMPAARIRIEQALKADPDSSLAHEGMGLIHFNDGKDQEALREFERAVQLNERSYLAHYYQTMLSPKAVSNEATDQNTFRSSLLRVLELNPNFAPAYVELAALDIRQNNLKAALLRAQQAMGLAPSKAGYHTLVARLLQGVGRGQENEALDRTVAERESERDETIAARQKLPDVIGIGDEFTSTPSLEKTTRAAGKVTSLTCNEEEGTIRVVLDGVPLTLRIPGTMMHGRFSDTLWYGLDQFSFCHHLEGLQATVYYHPSAKPNELGSLSQVHLRREFLIRP
jgi:Tfp pilus assembly protein PilF